MRRTIPDAIAPLIALDPTAGPLHQQIGDGYRAAILDGRLRPGQRVPSTRALAAELGISRLPVLSAFEQLLHEGYFEGRVGSGTYVAAAIGPKAGARKAATARRAAIEEAAETAVRTTAVAMPSPESVAFRINLPALDQFPRKTWARLVARHARSLPIEAMAYGDAAGCLPLRQAIADYLRTARAVKCDASQVLIVSGSQMALQLCARVLLKPGDTYCVEEPGYPGARDALGATGASLRTAPVDADGLIVRALEAASPTPRAVYVTPSHQYPLGVSMNAARRLELLAWARRQRAWILEDDYDSEYRYASRPLGALQGMDTAARVIYIGTFSKVLFPALRIGYVVVPPELVAPFTAVRRALDLFSPTLYQYALTDFLREGHFARHVRRMRAVYQRRRDVLVTQLQQRLGDTLRPVNTDAGMHLAAWLPAASDDQRVVSEAAQRGLSVTALSACYAGRKAQPGLVLGFGGAAEAALMVGVDTLAQAIEAATSRKRLAR